MRTEYAHAGNRTRVTSMGGLYDAVTLHALDHFLKKYFQYLVERFIADLMELAMNPKRINLILILMAHLPTARAIIVHDGGMLPAGLLNLRPRG